jgi:thiamine-phosphate pyrophosphorylase
MAKKTLPPLYLISDAERVGEERLLEVVEAAAGAGLRMVQLREPGWPLDRIAGLGARLEALLGPRGIIILSVHPGEDGTGRERLIRELGLSGGHLGRCGPEQVPAARDRLGPDLLLGYSAHSPEEAQRALEGGADYASCSPVFAPLSKTGAPSSALLGLGGLRLACSGAAGAVYALGGITAGRVREVQEAGAAGAAVIGALLAAGDPAAACRALLAPWRAAEKDEGDEK